MRNYQEYTKKKLRFIDLKTRKNGFDRNVTISYSPKEKGFFLLGNLEHNTELILTNEFVTRLYTLVKESETK